MKTKYIFLSIVLYYSNALAQEQPPVIFPSGATVCDPTPYKLVFDEEFDGNSIDLTKWHTWCNYSGPYEGDDWSNGRWDFQGSTTIIRDQNVVVSGGTVKLQIKHGPESWQCTGCPIKTANYSSGWLTTRYNPGFCYNSGRFEAKIKFPKSNYTWSTMWLYHGDAIGVNEIDIAEAHGGPFFPAGPFGQNNHFTCSYSLHAQSPPSGSNPYNLGDVEIANSYPHQSWWDKVNGTYFDLDNWHTYTCDWDTALITTYLDGNIVNKIPKYYYYQLVPVYHTFLFYTWTTYIKVYQQALCATVPNQIYHITTGFPWNNSSASQLRFSTQMFQDEANLGSYSYGQLKAQMEIDYVRIWQRHPEADLHTDLCAGTTLAKITGPDIVCGSAIYNVDQSIDGTWSVSDNLSITGNNRGIHWVSVQTSPYDVGQIKFHYGPAGCPGHDIVKWVDVGPPNNAAANVVKTVVGANAGYNLFAVSLNIGVPSFNSPTTYEWMIHYGPPGRPYYAHLYGQHVSTLPLPNNPTYGISWTLIVTNACGSQTITGSRSNNEWARMIQPEGPNITYYSAEITDSIQFQSNVESRMQKHYFTEEESNDSTIISQVFEKAIAEELAPYILDDSIYTIPEEKRINVNGLSTTVDKNSNIVPNPTSSKISINLSDRYDINSSISIVIQNTSGFTILKKETSQPNIPKIDIDVSSFPTGLYYVTLQQLNKSEHIKLVKL